MYETVLWATDGAPLADGGAEEVLEKGNKVRMHMQFREREMAHRKLGLELMGEIKRDRSQLAVDFPSGRGER